MKRLIGLGTALVLIGCSGNAPETDEPVAGEPDAAIAEAYAQPLRAAEGDAKLTPLAADAATTAGLGASVCTFTYQDRPLMLTGAGKGVAVLDGREIALAGEGPVWNADGTDFVVVPGEAGSAELRITSADGETRFSPGTWTCAS